MKLFKENITPRLSTLGDKIYPLVVDIKKGVKSGDAINFVTADNEVGILSIELVNGDEPYDISGCIVCGTIQRPDTSTLNIYCDIVGVNKLEIPLGVSGTYQEGIHNFDLKIYRGNEKIIGVPTMSYTVTGSLSSDGVVEGDDRLPVLTTVLDNAQDKLTRLDKAIAGATNDLEVKEARDGEVTLNARLERDLKKGKIHFVDVEGSNVSTESQEGYLENVEIHGNTWQDINNLADIRSVGTKVEGQELYEIDVVSTGKNICTEIELGSINSNGLNANSKANFRSKYFVSIAGGSTIRASSGNDNLIPQVVYQYDKDFNCLGAVQNNITLSNAKYVKVVGRHIVSGSDITNYIPDAKIQLEYGTVATPYEPYKEDKLTILSPVQLEKVGNVADRIVCKDSVWGVEKNIITKVYDGTESWKLSSSDANTNQKYCVLQNENSFVTNVMITAFNNRFVHGNPYSQSGACLGVINNQVRVRTLNGDETLDGFKVNLKELNLIVKYPASQPQFIPLPHDQQIKLRTFAGRTNIHFETEIEGTIKAQVPKSLGATVSTHATQIDNLNKELDRVKKLEESTVSTVTSDKAFTTVAETNGGYFEDVRIEGKTLVNLATTSKITITDVSNKVISRKGFKKGEVYTLAIFTKNKNTTSKIYLGYTSAIGYSPNSFMDLSVTDYCVNKFRMATDENTWGIGGYAGFEGSVDIELVLLEGDHTDKDITFFEGLKSVGQDVDEISVLSVNENLFMETNCVSTGSVYWYYVDIHNLSEVSFSVKGYSKSQTNYSKLEFYTTDLLPVGTAYNQWKNVAVKNVPFNVETDINCNITNNLNQRYLVIFMAKAKDNNYEFREFSVTTKATNTYTNPKSNKKPLLYYNPTTQTWEKPILREWDSIEKHSDGKYYYHKRSNEVRLTGVESGLKITELPDTIRLHYNPIIKHKENGLCISNSMPTISGAETGVEGVFIGKNYGINIELLKSKLSTQDVEGFKAWLQANPTTVVYQLAQEEVYECTNLDLITYNGETNLIVSSGAIQPRITLKVLSNVSNVVKLLQEKVSVLESKFIEGLKQVLAGDMMSLAYLLYPEDFENNHEIQTLEL